MKQIQSLLLTSSWGTSSCLLHSSPTDLLSSSSSFFLVSSFFLLLLSLCRLLLLNTPNSSFFRAFVINSFRLELSFPAVLFSWLRSQLKLLLLGEVFSESPSSLPLHFCFLSWCLIITFIDFLECCLSPLLDFKSLEGRSWAFILAAHHGAVHGRHSLGIC